MLLKYFPGQALKPLLVVWLIVMTHGMHAQSSAPFFDGRSLKGWSSSNPGYWAVEKKSIVGHASEKVDKNQFLWSDTEVEDFYLSVDVLLLPDDRNAGIQFRSRKADSTGQAIGYQADIGREVWGRLYHEHDRGKLDWSDRGEKAVRPGRWNRYEILAVGDRIWTAINGQLAVAVRDPGGERKGYIALQIHSGPPQTVKYKIRKLVHNPPVKLAGMDEKRLNEELKVPLASAAPKLQKDPVITDERVIAIAGGTNMANMRLDGYLETLLYVTAPRKDFSVWNLGWDGDTVYEQFRDVGFGSWEKNLDSLGAEAVLLQFGQIESLEGPDALPRFVAAYKDLISKVKKPGLKIILVSPIPFEPERLFTGITLQNPLKESGIFSYANAIAGMAGEEGCHYIDLYTPLSGHPAAGTLTLDGMRLNSEGQKLVAGIIAGHLRGSDLVYTSRYEPVRKEVIEKNYLWTSYWRPGNWAFLYGDRTTQPFSHDWLDRSKRIFPQEVQRFEPMIMEAERRIMTQKEKQSLRE